jgi:hypothetical protein
MLMDDKTSNALNYKHMAVSMVKTGFFLMQNFAKNEKRKEKKKRDIMLQYFSFLRKIG